MTIISSRNLHWNVEHVPHFTKSGRVYPQAFSKLQFSTYPGHTLVPMPSLSPVSSSVFVILLDMSFSAIFPPFITCADHGDRVHREMVA